MSQAEELLNSLAEVDEGDYEEDDTPYFVIDPTTRTITPPAGFTNLGVESDEKAKTIHFKSPRRVSDTVDLAALNLYINYRNANKQEDAHIADVTEVTDEYIYFSWELKRKVTRYKGTVDFIVCAMRTKSDGTISNEWNTTLCKGNVLEGLEVDNPEVDEETVDLVDQLVSIVKTNMAEVEETTSRVLVEIEDARVGALQDIDITRKDAVTVVEGARDESVAAVDAVKESVLAYIGTGVDKTLSKENLAADAKATGDAVKSVAIIPNATGSVITTTDSAETGLAGLKIYGESEQFSTTGKNLYGGDVHVQPNVGTSISSDTFSGELTVTQSQYSEDVSYVGHFNNGCVYMDLNVDLLTVGNTYSFVCDAKETSSLGGIEFSSFRTNPTSSTLSKIYISGGKLIYPFTLLEGVTRIEMRLNGNSYVLNNAMILEGSYTADTLTEYEPYTGGEASPNPNYPQEITSVGDSGSVDLKVQGENLFLGNYTLDNMTCVDGVYTQAAADDSTTPKFKLLLYDKNNKFSQVHGGLSMKTGIYKLNFVKDDTTVYLRFAVNGKTRDTVFSTNISSLPNGTYTFVCNVTNITQGSFSWRDVMIVPASATDITYEPPKPLQSATFETPDGLRRIPNTDIRDEIDLERGVRIQRVGEYRNTGEPMSMASAVQSAVDKNIIYWNHCLRDLPAYKPNTTVAIISNYFRYHHSPQNNVYACMHATHGNSNKSNYLYFSAYAEDLEYGTTYTNVKEAISAWLAKTFSEENPLIVWYPLAEPIETPLTDEEIAAYKALHTYKPNTTIYNSEGADMSVDYIADPEIYIEQNYVAKDAFEALEARVEALEG